MIYCPDRLRICRPTLHRHQRTREWSAHARTMQARDQTSDECGRGRIDCCVFHLVSSAFRLTRGCERHLGDLMMRRDDEPRGPAGDLERECGDEPQPEPRWIL